MEGGVMSARVQALFDSMSYCDREETLSGMVLGEYFDPSDWDVELTTKEVNHLYRLLAA
jgi:hypothetical protein